MTITEGADTDELDQLAQFVEQGATRVDGIYGPVLQAFHGSGWQGPDADQFANEWAGPSKARLTQATTALREAARALRRNAQEQRQASDQASPSGGHGAVGPGAGRPGGFHLHWPTWGTVRELLGTMPFIGTGMAMFDVLTSSPRGLYHSSMALYDQIRYGADDPRTRAMNVLADRDMHEFNHHIIDTLTGVGGDIVTVATGGVGAAPWLLRVGKVLDGTSRMTQAGIISDDVTGTSYGDYVDPNWWLYKLVP